MSTIITNRLYEVHRELAAQTEAIYIEINKLATKKPTERITKLISLKINHLITEVKNIVRDDDFLNAIDTVPVNNDFIRFDETLIILAELRSALKKKWQSESFKIYRKENSLRNVSLVERF